MRSPQLRLNGVCLLECTDDGVQDSLDTMTSETNDAYDSRDQM